MEQFVEQIAGPKGQADDDLVARAQRGDRLAFGRLVEIHYDFIFRVACKWSGKRSDAEDIAQDVCVKLASILASFDGRAKFTSWLYRVVINAVRDMQRARGRRGKHIDAFSMVHAEATPPDQEDAVAMTELWQAVGTLPEKQREAVMLIYAEEMSHAEAGEIMGCKEATVSWHIHEAKKTLRGLL